MSENLPPYPGEPDVPGPAPVPVPPLEAQPLPPPPPVGDTDYTRVPPPPRETMAYKTPGVTVTDDETLWAAIGHLSILLFLVMGWIKLGLLIPLVPFAIYHWKKDSPYVRWHCAQACAYQVATMAITTMLAVIGLVLLFIIIGFIPLMLGYLLGLAATAFGVYAGIQAKQGQLFRYPIIADLVESQLKIHPPSRP